MAVLLALVLAGMPGGLGGLPVKAGVKTQAAREAAEMVMKKFGREAGQETVETLAVRVESLATKHGDEVIAAVKKAGPQGLHAIEQAGAAAPQAAKVLSRFGDEGLRVAREPKSLALFTKYGDDAAEAMIKHPGVADDLVAAYGNDAARAISKLDAQNANRLGMMLKDESLATVAKGKGSNELLEVIGKYGDRGMEFVWKHKKALTVSAALTAFLANPQPFLDGTRDFAEFTTAAVAENVVKPLAEAPKAIATKVAERTDWTPVLLAIVAVVATYLFARNLLPRLLRREGGGEKWSDGEHSKAQRPPER